jgi:hypothetical protein
MDYNELERELKKMKPRSKLFELIKSEMKIRGHWKNRVRGFHVKHIRTPQEFHDFIEKEREK